MRNVLGDPSKCLNRNCRHEFYKESNIGFIPQSPSEITVVMMCPKCRDVFAITQVPSMLEDYIGSLSPKPKPKISRITSSEIKNVRDVLAGDNVLVSILDSSVFEGKED